LAGVPANEVLPIEEKESIRWIEGIRETSAAVVGADPLGGDAGR